MLIDLSEIATSGKSINGVYQGDSRDLLTTAPGARSGIYLTALATSGKAYYQLKLAPTSTSSAILFPDCGQCVADYFPISIVKIF